MLNMIFRSEKKRSRTRHIYALLFANNCCYVGQSVNLLRRKSQHSHRRGNWNNQKFTMIELDRVKGAYADAEDLECAWRCCAQRNGWTIYGIPPNIVVDPTRKLNRKRSQLLQRCVWPKRHRTVRAGSAALKIFMAVGVFLGVCAYMGWLPHVVTFIGRLLSF